MKNTPDLWIRRVVMLPYIILDLLCVPLIFLIFGFDGQFKAIFRDAFRSWWWSA